MRKYLRRVIGHGETARHRAKTLLIVAVTALLMLIGIGQRVLDSHSNLGDADHLAALSLIMSGVPEGALPVTFLDVDNDTRQAWQARDVTPHGPIAELIKLASANGASAILADFDIGAGGDPAGDAVLASVLRNYPASAPQLMLVRRIQFAPAEAEAGSTAVQAGSATPTPFDADVVGKANIHWITTLNDIGRDRSVRKIKLWQSVCSGAGGVAYPSAALVAAAYVAGEKSRGEDLKAFLQQRVAVECGHETDNAPGWPPVRDAGALLPYVFANSHETPALFRIDVKGRQTIVLRRISAALLVRLENGNAVAAADVDRDPFEGRITIIGASYTDSGDTYETPFGTMPGAVVLANSVVQAKTIVEAKPVSSLTRNVLAMLLFLLLAYVARTFIGAAAIIILGLVTLAALFGISRWLGFTTGIDVISVAVPGFALFKLIDSLIFIGMSVPKLGWRAVLKP